MADAQLAQTIELLTTQLLIHPNDPHKRFQLGMAYRNSGELEEAIKAYKRALRAKPDHAEAHFNLAVFYLQRNPPAVELARRHYQKARDLGAAPDPDVERTLNAPNP